MTSEVIGFSALSMLINVTYAIVSVVIAMLFFRLLDVLIIKGIDTLDEIKKGNVAVAIIAGFIIFSVSLIIGLSMR